MCGFSASFRIGTAACDSMNVPRTLTSCIRSYFFAARSSDRDRSITLALLTTMSMPPNSPWVFSTASVMSSSLRTSPDDRQRLPAGRADLLGGRVHGALELRVRRVGLREQRDVRAVGGGAQRDREADAAAAARHQDGLACQALVGHLRVLPVERAGATERLMSRSFRCMSQTSPAGASPGGEKWDTIYGAVADLRDAAAKAATRIFDSSVSKRAPIDAASSARFSSNDAVGANAHEALGLPERGGRVLEPEPRDLLGAPGDVGKRHDLGDETPVERLSGVQRAVLQQQLQRAPLSDRRGKQRRDAQVGSESDVRVLAHELRRLRRDDVVGASA